MDDYGGVITAVRRTMLACWTRGGLGCEGIEFSRWLLLLRCSFLIVMGKYRHGAVVRDEVHVVGLRLVR